MRIYVSELPKNCKECPLCRSGRLKIQKGARYIDAETCVLGDYLYELFVNDMIEKAGE